MGLARMLSAALLFATAGSAAASGSYEFCVDRASASKREVLHVRFKYGDINPGRESARLIISQRYRQGDTTSVGVTDYNEANCNKREIEEITVSATPEQLQNLANAVGTGNMPGAVIVAADIAAGATIAVVTGAGKAAGGIIETVKKLFCGIFGCN